MDYTPHVFKTIDGGQNWTDISSNLPSIPVNDIVIKRDESTLFVATDLNVWASTNDGVSWGIVGNNLPLTIIRDLKIHEPTNTLYAGTFGRSIHSYDLNGLVLGVDETIATATEITVYPNPTSETLNINHQISGNGSITLYDTSGKLVAEFFNGALEGTQVSRYSVENISSGMYMLHIKTSNKRITKRVIVR